MSRLSLRCEVPSCGFRTPELPSLHYPAMVEQLKLHTSQLHGTVATSQLHTNQLNSPEAAASKARSPSASSRSSLLIKPTTTTQVSSPKTATPRTGHPPFASPTTLSSVSPPAAATGEVGTSSGTPPAKARAHRKRRLDLGFPCTDCHSTSFQTEAGLNRHRSIYCTQEIRCCRCELSFTSVIELNTHKCAAGGEGEVTCSGCGREFGMARALKLHRMHCKETNRTEVEEARFPCTYCDKKLTTSRGLVTHEMTMHSEDLVTRPRPSLREGWEEKQACGGCGKEGLTGRHLRAHKKQCHGPTDNQNNQMVDHVGRHIFGKVVGGEEAAAKEKVEETVAVETKANGNGDLDREDAMAAAAEAPRAETAAVVVKFVSASAKKYKLKMQLPRGLPMQRVMDKVGSPTFRLS